LTRVSHFKDLGICFNSSLSFNDHYAYIKNKSSSMLGLVSRMCLNFNNSIALKSLYIDYNSVIWSPHMSGPTEVIETILNRFLRFLAFKYNVQRQRHTLYSPLLTLTSLETLQIRGTRLDICFTFKLLNGIINCSELLSKFNFLVPNTRTRESNKFYVQFCGTNYDKKAPRVMAM